MKKPKTIRLDTLHPDPRNPRKIKDADLDKLCRLVARYPKFMALRPIVIDADGRIVAGTQRHKACLKNGMTEVPAEWVRRATDLTPEELKAFQVVDNVNAGEFDMDILTADWDIPDLEALGVDCGDIKDEAEPTDPRDEVVEDDQAAQLQKKWGTEVGQLWVCGDHRILCGSSTDPDNWKRLMNGRKAALCNTDPPYGVSYSSSTGKGKKWEVIQGDNKREDDLLATLLVPALRLAVEHAEPDAAFYIWHATSSRRDFEAAIDAVGLAEKQYITWVKDAFVLGHADYHWQTEPAFYCQKAGNACRWLGNRSQTTVWRIRPPAPAEMALTLANGMRLSDGDGNSMYVAPQAPKTRKTRLIRLGAGESVSILPPDTTDAWQITRDPAKDRLHPTQKPVRLFVIPIMNHTLPGDIVAEPFSGSGSQFIAAQATGRRCYGCDLDPKYVAVALERLTMEGVKCELEKA